MPYDVIYFSHGGGPLPLMDDPGHRAMIAFMRALPCQVIQPKRIVVFSAHWEEPQPTVISAAQPSLFYDYYGFPPETYRYQYPAPGDPALARAMAESLTQQGIPARLAEQRGLDHGVFVPLLLSFPQADIPVSQVSLIQGLDPSRHLELGAALRPFRDGSTLFIGSGFSFHNMRAFSWSQNPTPDSANDQFQDWLIETTGPTLTQPERVEQLRNWTEAPSARYCHPREEHLLPLHVCAALADAPGEIVFDDAILGKRGIAVAWHRR